MCVWLLTCLQFSMLFCFPQLICTALHAALLLPPRLHCQDLATGKELMDPIRNTSGDVVWASDNATLFYIVKVSSACTS